MGVDVIVECDCHRQGAPSPYASVSCDIPSLLGDRSLADDDVAADVSEEVGGPCTTIWAQLCKAGRGRSPDCKVHPWFGTRSVRARPYWVIETAIDLIKRLGPDQYPYIYVFLYATMHHGSYFPPEGARRALGDLGALGPRLRREALPCVELLDLETKQVFFHALADRGTLSFGDVEIDLLPGGMDIRAEMPDGAPLRLRGVQVAIPEAVQDVRGLPRALGYRLGTLGPDCFPTIWGDFRDLLRRAVSWDNPVRWG